MRKLCSFLLVLGMLLSLLTGCGSAGTASEVPPSSAASTVIASSDASSPEKSDIQEQALPDGVYSAEFETDSSMFRVNEACDGKGTLTVQDGKMTIHISLMSQKIVNLFPGTAEDAEKEGAVWLEPTVDTVTYSDGLSEEVYGFDVPVPVIGEEFDLALVGTKGTWYDHKVSVQNPVPLDADAESSGLALEDGAYTCAVTLEGGSGKATVESPAELRVENGEVFATIIWSSPNYDYMLVDDQRYEPVNTEGNSTFEIPVGGFDVPLTVVADTVAMSTPHEITYTLTFDSSTLQEKQA